MEEMLKEDGGWNSNFMTTDLSYFVDELQKHFFDHVPIESSPKFVQFTLASRNLMIDCLRKERWVIARKTYTILCHIWNDGGIIHYNF